MQILHNEYLKKYTTIKIGGYAENFYYPESPEELMELLNKISNEKYYIISGGSNILMNDKKEYKHVIHMKKVDTTIKGLGNGRYYVGASVSIQKLLKDINKEGYGGIEYLYSVPAYVGGAIAMNAGRGHKSGLAISDYLEEVYVFDSNKKQTLTKSQCNFKYRDSIFKHDSNLTILGAVFNFKQIDSSVDMRKERMNLVKEKQDYSSFNFGSVFRERNTIIMHLLKLIHPGYKRGIQFSGKTANWLLNKGEGTFDQAIKLINTAKSIHKVIGKKAVTEVIIWNDKEG